jgi:uncharacterized membrane protein YidH (DUF202 family)
VRRSSGRTTRLPETARVGLRAAALFETMDSVEEVADFLRELDLGQYVATFRAHAVTGSTLVSLSAVELREMLGVRKLKDRRAVLDAVGYVKEQMDPVRKSVLPEDGRILTHLSNERTYLVWVRLVVIMLTTAVMTVPLTELGPDAEANRASIVASAVVLCVCAVSALAFAFNRYFWMHRMVEAPGQGYSPGNLRTLTPGLLVPTFAVILAYALMANNNKEVALLALLSV